MGWNDRLPEDPHIPYESENDRNSYDEWAQYLEACRLGETGGLTSNTVDPQTASLPADSAQLPQRVDVEKLLEELIDKKAGQT